MPNGTRRVGLDVDAAQAACAVLESSGVEGPRTIVMGLDRHRAQITAEWIDTATGEIARARVAPAHRDGVRRFLRRFRGLRVEAALEATTGWRFVAESCARSALRCIWPSRRRPARGGNQKRATTDRADARHLRELLMVGRLPESWIPPDHLLDPRAGAAASRAGQSARRVPAAQPRGPPPPRAPAAP